MPFSARFISATSLLCIALLHSAFGQNFNAPAAWTTIQIPNSPLSWFATASFPQSAILFGGKMSENDQTRYPQASVYNPQDNSWISIPYPGQAREGAKGAVAGRYAFFGGGYTNQMNPVQDIDVYDSTSQTFFNPPAQLSSTRISLCAVATSSSGTTADTVIFGGGLSGTNVSLTLSSNVDVFSITSPTTRNSLAPLSQARSLPGCSSYTDPSGTGSIVVFAGGVKYSGAPFPAAITQNYVVSNVADIYTITPACLSKPSSVGCLKSSPLPVALAFAQGATVGSKMIFAGGFSAGGTMNQGWSTFGVTISSVAVIYDVPSNSWSVSSALSVPRFFANAAAVGGATQGSASSGSFYVYGPGNSMDSLVLKGPAGSPPYVAPYQSAAVDITDGNGNWWSSNVSVARAQVGVVAVGSKVIFAGGVTSKCNGAPVVCSDTDVNVVDVLDMAVAVCNGNGRCDSNDFLTNGVSCSCNCNSGWTGTTCSAPLCPAYVLGANGSCNFNGLTDVTKAFAILGMVFPALIAIYAVWRIVMHYKASDPMAPRLLRESLLGDNKL